MEQLETDARTMIVVVDRGQDTGSLLAQGIALARAQSETTGIPYRQIVLFYPAGGFDAVHRLEANEPIPAGLSALVAGDDFERRVVEVATALAPDDFALFLVTADGRRDAYGNVRGVVQRLAAFQAETGVRGHIVLLGHELPEDVYGDVQTQLSGATVIAMPGF